MRGLCELLKPADLETRAAAAKLLSEFGTKGKDLLQTIDVDSHKYKAYNEFAAAVEKVRHLFERTGKRTSSGKTFGAWSSLKARRRRSTPNVILDRNWGGSLETDAEAADAVSINDLMECLRDADLETRERAAEAFRAIGPAAIPALGNALDDPDMDYRAWIAIALGNLGPAAVPVLAKALEDDTAYVRDWASLWGR